MEITQGIQDLGNNVPLVEDRPTWVRVYVDCGIGCTSVDGVTAILHGYQDDGTELPDSPLLYPNPVMITARHAEPEELRWNREYTLNFYIPSNWLQRYSVLRLRAEVNPDGPNKKPESNPNNNFYPALSEPPLSRQIHTQRELSVAYVPIHYEPAPLYPRPKDPVEERIREAYRYLLKVYPLTKIEYIPWPGFNWDKPLTDDKHAQELKLKLTELLLAGGEQHPDQIYGWLPEGAYAYQGNSDPIWLGGLGLAAFGNDNPSESDAPGFRSP